MEMEEQLDWRDSGGKITELNGDLVEGDRGGGRRRHG